MYKLLLLLTICTSAFATNYSIEISDFYRLNSADTTDRAAEVCGTVSPAPASPLAIHVVSDPDRNSQGDYVTHTAPNGKFCHVIATFYGQVQVSIYGSKKASAKLIK